MPARLDRGFTNCIFNLRQQNCPYGRIKIMNEQPVHFKGTLGRRNYKRHVKIDTFQFNTKEGN